MKWFFLSLFLHSVIWWQREDNILPPPTPAAASAEQRVTVKLLDAEGSVNRPCLHSYFGIGMVTDNSTGVVEQVALGLPAWKAGLRTGDIVTSDVGSMCGGRCSPGMRAKVDWMRGRESFSAEMEVQKICKE